MILAVLAFLGGALTIFSPCILPVLPFVFSRAEAPFRKSGLPLLCGLAVMFVIVSTLAVAGGSWVIHANEYGRWAALILFSLLACTLLFPQAAEWVMRPFTRLGGTLQGGPAQARGPWSSFILGAATGLLWAPCAGPILGLILTSAAVKGAHAGTTGLLLAYALGASASLAVVLRAGSELLKKLRGFLGVEESIRKILGVSVLLGVLAIALGWDRGALTTLSRFRTEAVEQKLITALHPSLGSSSPSDASSPQKFDLSGAVSWINSPPLTAEALKGKIVLVDFWTYSCINCLRSIPYVEAWAEKYKDSGLVVIGVHTPEFAFEKDPDNVAKAVKELGLTYPIALDNNYAVWNAFDNRYWPAHYFMDGKGVVRHHHFGEGEYAESEHVLQKLLTENGASHVPGGTVDVRARGAQASGLDEEDNSHETYIGSSRSENQVPHPAIGHLTLNQWGLTGAWSVHSENAELRQTPGKILFRFHARDLHLVLGPGAAGKPIRFVVRLDGKAPGAQHGTDSDEAGQGVVRDQRLYQLIRQNPSGITDHTFEIEFLDPGVQAFAFTFG